MKEMPREILSSGPRPGYKTPPYLIVDPVVTTTKIEGRGSFVMVRVMDYGNMSVVSKQ